MHRGHTLFHYLGLAFLQVSRFSQSGECLMNSHLSIRMLVRNFLLVLQLAFLLAISLQLVEELSRIRHRFSAVHTLHKGMRVSSRRK